MTVPLSHPQLMPSGSLLETTAVLLASGSLPVAPLPETTMVVLHVKLHAQYVLTPAQAPTGHMPNNSNVGTGLEMQRLSEVHEQGASLFCPVGRMQQALLHGMTREST